jgi:hypothetical protein
MSRPLEINLSDAGWTHAIGVASLFAFIVFGFLAVDPADIASKEA